jgi:probable addiction module antidote protein
MTTEVVPFDPAEYLNDEEAIAEFLNASAEIGDPAVLLSAIAVAAKARSMTDLADKAGLGRESLYKALAPGAHPRYETVIKLITAMGVTVRFEALTVKSIQKIKPARRKQPTQVMPASQG